MKDKIVEIISPHLKSNRVAEYIAEEIDALYSAGEEVSNDFEPFSKEWEAELMKVKKADLIFFYKRALMWNQQSKSTRPTVSEGEIDESFDVWDWVVTKGGKVVQITDDDMSDLPYEEIYRKATVEDMASAAFDDWIKEFDIVTDIQVWWAAINWIESLNIPLPTVSEEDIVDMVDDLCVSSFDSVIPKEKIIKTYHKLLNR